MKLLLDTHAFLWLLSSPGKLSAGALAACQDTGNSLLVSCVSLWEIQIKHQNGRLELDLPFSQIVAEQIGTGAFEALLIEPRHILAIDELPLHHGDPFDRLLIAQARCEGASFVTADRLIHERYAQLVSLIA